MQYKNDKIYYDTINHAKALIGKDKIYSIIDSLTALNEDFKKHKQLDKVFDIEEEYHNFLLKNKSNIKYEVELNNPYIIHEMANDTFLTCPVKSFDNMYDALKYRSKLIPEDYIINKKQ